MVSFIQVCLFYDITLCHFKEAKHTEEAQKLIETSNVMTKKKDNKKLIKKKNQHYI